MIPFNRTSGITTSSYRLTLPLLISDQEIILLDVGSHDAVYR